jgi:dTDP-glucose 4,6-dehydratase
MDYSLARKELGFEPSRSFEQGLAETLIWYKDNPSWISGLISGDHQAFQDAWYGDRL